MIRILALAKSLGITSLQPEDNNLSSALGGLTKGVRPIDMAEAYATLANGGVQVKPVAITKIVDRNGNILEENSIEEKRVVDEKDAYVITNMLESVITNGTGGNAAFGRPLAGKTGTTDDSKDAWFVGYTPDLAAAVWVGDDFGSQTLHGMTVGDTPAIIFNAFMSQALANTPVSDFPVPAGAESVANQGYYHPVATPAASETKAEESSDKKEEASSSKEEASEKKQSEDEPKQTKKSKKKKSKDE